MKSRTRIIDVALRAGVSVATVSRAFARPDMVRPETRERIQRAAQELDYVMDGAARALALGRARTVGAVVPTLDNAVFAQAVHGLQTVLNRSGYQLLIAAHEYDLDQESRQIRALVESAAEALVVVGAEHAESAWQFIRQSRIPLLIAWSSHDRLPYIGFDNERIGRLAAEHLLELGHRHFGIITGHRANNDRTRARCRGFLHALRRAGIAESACPISEQTFSFEGGRQGLHALLHSGGPAVTGVFCGNDVLAMGCLFEAQDLGLDVPGRLSIVGCDGLPIVSQMHPSITTIDLPTLALGQACAKALLDWLEHDRAPASVTFDIQLRQGQTSAMAP
ncbi:LacI family DNA-binding transcriptional regulator [Alcaligenes sp. Marseille-Q7550]